MTQNDHDDGSGPGKSRPIDELENNLSPIVRIFGFLLLWWIGISIASSLVFPFVADLRAIDLPFLAATSVPNALATVLITTGFLKYVDRRPLQTLGLSRSGSWLAELGYGVLLGFVLIAVVFVIALAAGWSHIAGSLFHQSAGRIAFTILQSLLAMAGIAVTEEVAIRGYILQCLKTEYGRVAALIASSAIFGVMHFANPGAGLNALAGTLVAGLVLGYAYLVTNRLWLPVGLHFGWNFALGPIFGFPVSGVDIPSWVEQNGGGPALWIGGAFGPEAGVLGLFALALGMGAIFWFRTHWYRVDKPALETPPESAEDEIRDERQAA